MHFEFPNETRKMNGQNGRLVEMLEFFKIKNLK